MVSGCLKSVFGGGLDGVECWLVVSTVLGGGLDGGEWWS